jgi:hypothetical protein
MTVGELEQFALPSQFGTGADLVVPVLDVPHSGPQTAFGSNNIGRLDGLSHRRVKCSLRMIATVTAVIQTPQSASAQVASPLARGVTAVW